jgi:hypothetical protein
VVNSSGGTLQREVAPLIAADSAVPVVGEFESLASPGRGSATTCLRAVDV